MPDLGQGAATPDGSFLAFNVEGSYLGNGLMLAVKKDSAALPAEGRYRIHLPGGPKDLGVMEDALAQARDAASQLAEDRARKAGAGAVTIDISEDIKLVPLGGGKEMFIEALIHATADGAAS